MACLVPQQLYSHFPEYGVFKNRTELHAGQRTKPRCVNKGNAKGDDRKYFIT